MTHILLITISLLLLVCGCADNNKKTNHSITHSEGEIYNVKITLPDKKNLDDVFLSDIADSLYYLPIKNDAIVRIMHIIQTKNMFVDIGSIPYNAYDSLWNFKSNIGMTGHGYGEYIRPAATVDIEKNLVYVWSEGSASKIMQYDISDLPVSFKILSNETFAVTRNRRLASVGNNILQVYELMDYKNSPPLAELRLYNPELNQVIDSLPDYHNIKYNYAYGSYMYPTNAVSNYKNELYYMSVYADTLYKITEDKIKPFIAFDFGKYKYSAELIGMRSPESYNFLNNKIKLNAISRFGQTLYIKFNYSDLSNESNQFAFIYALDLISGEGRYCKHFFINDLDNGPDWIIGSFGNDRLVQVMDIAHLKISPSSTEARRIFPNNKMQKKLNYTDSFAQLWDKSNDDSNPILQIIVEK